MRVAAYQAPLLPFGSFDAVEMIRDRLAECVAGRVELLVCPEAIIGGLAHGSDGQTPEAVALTDRELLERLRPLLPTAIPAVIGFTERSARGEIFNSAAIVRSDSIMGIYRKVFPGYRTVVRSGSDLPVFDVESTTLGIAICNDVWYVEPTRILAERGAAVLCIPVNGQHAPDKYRTLEARGRNLLLARAVETTTSLIAADIAGRADNRISAGTTAIIDPDGTVLATASPYNEDLIVAEVEPQRRAPTPRGRDGWTNASVAEAFLDLWKSPTS